MKNATLSFALLLLFSTLLSGQGLNRQYALGHTSIAGGIAAGPNGQCLLVGYYGSYSVSPFAMIYEAATDEYITIELSEYLEQPYDEIIGISNVVYDALSSKYYFALSRIGCDYGLSQLLISLNAANLSVASIELPQGFYGGNYQLMLIPGEGILLASNYAKEVLYRNGEFYDIFEEEYESIRKLENWSQGRFLFLSEQSLVVAQLDLSSNTAEVNTTTDAADGLAIAVLDDSEILLLRSSGLERYNADLEMQQHVPFVDPTHLAKDEDYLYVLAADGIHFLDHNLNEVSLIAEAEVADHRVLAAAAKNGQLLLTGSYQVAPDYNDYSFVKLPTDFFIRSYNADGAEMLSDTDLAITEVTHSLPEANLLPYNCMWARIGDITVTLTNEGSSTIEDATIALYIEGCGEPVICEAWTAKSWQETINLGPGESISLQLGDVYTNSIDASDNFGLCLRVFPSGETMETDITNNYSCATPMMVVDTEEAIVPVDFSVYPTICQDQLTLSLSANSGVFESAVVYNILGQPMLTKALPTGQISIPIDVSYLAAGSYFIRLEGEKRSQMVTFVKN